MSALTELYKGTTMRMLQSYVQQYIDQHCQEVWEQNRSEIERIFEKNGDSAYGFFCRKLFEPLVAEIVEAGFLPRPLLPGTFPQSEEHWGPWEDRERRFWSVIYRDNDQPLGTLVSKIFHDHTCLRLPRQPKVYLIYETDPIRIAEEIMHADLLGGSKNRYE
jgi:hypothetical protein